MSRSRKWAWVAGLTLPAALGPLWVSGLQPPGWSLFGTWAGMLVVLLIVTCASTDLAWRKIFNWATYPAVLWAIGINVAGSLAGAIPMNTVGEQGTSLLGNIGVDQCLLGLGACFLAMLFVHSFAKGGAGDVKLAAALGALLGLERGFFALVCTFIFGGVVVVAWVIWKVGPTVLLASFLRLIGSFLLPRHVAPPSPEQRLLLKSPVPLGLFFGLGALAALLPLDHWL